ncbi:hypothetical protein PPERSA_01226 [Pseudocohnilembus persalinus]|uniref:Uncharacterized protein n=1 Tax=Pseudocohnilembus persalinus TaxID=266149 RepID=A0A0V0R973_PSEPJ|nr:hypothetical protein PPERSA_01226 [Pseudocohnilembus persalinus]|eukprot:KRX11027.1 hypothetical protein PPERSA_01226 [Pseudocohnilembus persalinus]
MQIKDSYDSKISETTSPKNQKQNYFQQELQKNQENISTQKELDQKKYNDNQENTQNFKYQQIQQNQLMEEKQNDQQIDEDHPKQIQTQKTHEINENQNQKKSDNFSTLNDNFQDYSISQLKQEKIDFLRESFNQMSCQILQQQNQDKDKNQNQYIQDKQKNIFTDSSNKPQNNSQQNITNNSKENNTINSQEYEDNSQRENINYIQEIQSLKGSQQLEKSQKLQNSVQDLVSRMEQDLKKSVNTNKNLQKEIQDLKQYQEEIRLTSMSHQYNNSQHSPVFNTSVNDEGDNGQQSSQNVQNNYNINSLLSKIKLLEKENQNLKEDLNIQMEKTEYYYKRIKEIDGQKMDLEDLIQQYQQQLQMKKLKYQINAYNTPSQLSGIKQNMNLSQGKCSNFSDQIPNFVSPKEKYSNYKDQNEKIICQIPNMEKFISEVCQIVGNGKQLQGGMQEVLKILKNNWPSKVESEPDRIANQNYSNYDYKKQYKRIQDVQGEVSCELILKEILEKLSQRSKCKKLVKTLIKITNIQSLQELYDYLRKFA